MRKKTKQRLKKIRVEKATVSDAKKIKKLVDIFSNDGKMLPRSLSHIYENIRDFYIVRKKKRVIGCVSLHVLWEDLVEIKSLAVRTSFQKKGIGTALVKHCISDAKSLGTKTVFALTYAPEFFEKLGFRRVSKNQLPKKIWGECFHCPKFPKCDETALALKLK
jgi:amino-acid N-acetyltransferase